MAQQLSSKLALKPPQPILIQAAAGPRFGFFLPTLADAGARFAVPYMQTDIAPPSGGGAAAMVRIRFLTEKRSRPRR
jgi:hypothetical protein